MIFDSAVILLCVLVKNYAGVVTSRASSGKRPPVESGKRRHSFCLACSYLPGVRLQVAVQ